MVKYTYYCDVCKKELKGIDEMSVPDRDLFVRVGMTVIYEKSIDEIVKERSIQPTRLDLCEDCRIKVVEGYSLLAKERMENLSFIE